MAVNTVLSICDVMVSTHNAAHADICSLAGEVSTRNQPRSAIESNCSTVAWTSLHFRMRASNCSRSNTVHPLSVVMVAFRQNSAKYDDRSEVHK